jgi:hypothetical protein
LITWRSLWIRKSDQCRNIDAEDAKPTGKNGAFSIRSCTWQHFWPLAFSIPLL